MISKAFRRPHAYASHEIAMMLKALILRIVWTAFDLSIDNPHAWIRLSMK